MTAVQVTLYRFPLRYATDEEDFQQESYAQVQDEDIFDSEFLQASDSEENNDEDTWHEEDGIWLCRQTSAS